MSENGGNERRLREGSDAWRWNKGRVSEARKEASSQRRRLRCQRDRPGGYWSTDVAGMRNRIPDVSIMHVVSLHLSDCGHGNRSSFSSHFVFLVFSVFPNSSSI